MSKENEGIKIFNDKKIRTQWDSEKEDWFFSAVDVCGILSESTDARKYWNKLKQRLKEEGSELVTNCHRLKMIAEDGKMRETAKTFNQSVKVAKRGGNVAKNARMQIETETGKKLYQKSMRKQKICLK